MNLLPSESDLQNELAKAELLAGKQVQEAIERLISEHERLGGKNISELAASIKLIENTAQLLANIHGGSSANTKNLSPENPDDTEPESTDDVRWSDAKYLETGSVYAKHFKNGFPTEALFHEDEFSALSNSGTIVEMFAPPTSLPKADVSDAVKAFDDPADSILKKYIDQIAAITAIRAKLDGIGQGLQESYENPLSPIHAIQAQANMMNLAYDNTHKKTQE